jgi:LEA14-like dessication related protein
MKKLAWLCGLLIVLSSCKTTFKALEYKECKNVKLNKIGFGTSTLEMGLVFFNPNKYEIQIQKAELEIFINGNPLGKTNQRLNTTLPKKAVGTIPLKIDIEMKNLLKNTISTISSEEVSIRAIGKISAGRHGIYKTVDIDYTTKQKVGLF